MSISSKKLAVAAISAVLVLAVVVALVLLLPGDQGEEVARGTAQPEESRGAAPAGPSPKEVAPEEIRKGVAVEEAVDIGQISEYPPRPPIPPGLDGVFEDTPDCVKRMKEVDALPDELPPEALVALRWLLRKPDEREALRNNVANRLRKCGDEHLVSDLTEMLWDGKETPKWRNYCTQHLYTCYAEKADPRILDTLFEAVECDEKLVRICAVWSLARAGTPRDESRKPDEETAARIREMVLAALMEKDAHFLITTAGVQSCAR
ncbi:MAG: HEAT repeat domain-containing protein, partial [Planctomycetota bacterium]